MARWLVAGGRLRGGGTRTAPPPGAIVAHFGLGTAGLIVWAVFLALGWPALARTAGGDAFRC